MPKLGDSTTEKLYLPTTKDAPIEDDKAWVVVRQELLLGDVSAIGSKTDDTEKAVALLTQLIVDWNFTDDGTTTGTKLPITEEWVGKLSLPDFAFLGEWMAEKLQSSTGGLDTDQKKTLSATSITVTDGMQA